MTNGREGRGHASYVRLKDGFSQTGDFTAPLFPRTPLSLSATRFGSVGSDGAENVAQKILPLRREVFFRRRPEIVAAHDIPGDVCGRGQSSFRETLRSGLERGRDGPHQSGKQGPDARSGLSSEVSSTSIDLQPFAGLPSVVLVVERRRVGRKVGDVRRHLASTT